MGAQVVFYRGSGWSFMGAQVVFYRGSRWSFIGAQPVLYSKRVFNVVLFCYFRHFASRAGPSTFDERLADSIQFCATKTKKTRTCTKLLRRNITGGPSIIFTRYHKAGKTFIRNTRNKCKSLIGLDCNALVPVNVSGTATKRSWCPLGPRRKHRSTLAQRTCIRLGSMPNTNGSAG